MSMNESGIQQRALELLGSGIGPEEVASAVGVSISRISQLVSIPEFAAQIADMRFQNLQKYNKRDNMYDTMEDTLLERLKNLIPLMLRPMEVLKAIQVINSAKRRGAVAGPSSTSAATIVNINMPVVIKNKFITDARNQVVRISEGEKAQDLVTIQSSTLLRNVTPSNTEHLEKIKSRIRELTHDQRTDIKDGVERETA